MNIVKLSKNLQITSVNATNVLDILVAIQRISKDKDVIILSMKEVEPPRGTNETTILYDDELNYEESESDKEDLTEPDDTQSPKIKNILRWLPKKKRDTSKKRERAEKEAIEEQKSRVRAQNAKRVDDILSVIKNNYLAAAFMYKEIKRIARERIVIDDIREMIMRVERSPKKGYKKSVLDCYKKAKAKVDGDAVSRLWGQPTNNMVINDAKDLLNDGVV